MTRRVRTHYVVHLDRQTYRDLSAHCERRQRTMAGYVREAVYDSIGRDQAAEKRAQSELPPWARAPFWKAETGER